MATPGAIVPSGPKGITVGTGQTVPIDTLMRMSAMDIIVTYGKDVYDLVAYLQAAGLVARDGRSNEDIRLQEQMQEKIALEGDCGVEDEYKAIVEARKRGK